MTVFLLFSTIFTSVFAASETQLNKNSNRLPAWTSQGCTAMRGYYYFVGYGEDNQLASSLQNAENYAKNKAILCLLDDYSFQFPQDKISEYISWKGFELVQNKIFYVNKEKDSLYTLYRWSFSDLDQEVKKLYNTSPKSKYHTKKQPKKLIPVITSKEKVKTYSIEENQKILDTIEDLECSSTTHDLIKAIGKPDKTEIIATSDYKFVNYVKFTWDQYIIKINNKYLKTRSIKRPLKGVHDKIVLQNALKAPIDKIYTDYGLTHNYYQICP